MDRKGMLIRSQPDALSCLRECVAARAMQRMPEQKVPATPMNHLRHHVYEIGLRFRGYPLCVATQSPAGFTANIWECSAYQQQRCLQGTEGIPPLSRHAHIRK
jgi:hypothetical protein